MGRWIKIYGDEQPTSTAHDERVLDRMERVLMRLQLKAFATKKPLTEKQGRAVFSYGMALQNYGRVRYLNEQEVKQHDYLMAKRFMRMLEHTGPLQEFEKATDGDEVDQYVKALPKRYQAFKKTV